jgi:hypothetical protein
MRGPAIVGCGALRHLLPLQLEPPRFIAKPASPATRRAADSIEPIGTSCGALPFGRLELGRSVSWLPLADSRAPTLPG